MQTEVFILTVPYTTVKTFKERGIIAKGYDVVTVQEAANNWERVLSVHIHSKLEDHGVILQRLTKAAHELYPLLAAVTAAQISARIINTCLANR